MALFDVGMKVLDKFIPDPEAKAKAQKELLQMQQEGKLAELNADMNEQNNISDRIFVSARKHYDEGKLTTRSFAGDKPDEPFFNLALIEADHKPHALPYQPTYWQPAMKRPMPAIEIKRKYLAFSVGGKMIPKQQQLIYDEFAKNASYKMKMPTLKVTHKMNQLPERTVI